MHAGPHRDSLRPPGLATAALTLERKCGFRGFTLLELVAVIAILAVLISLALPSYQGYMLRVNRTEAVAALLELAACQERVFATHGRYDTTRCTPEDLDHYSLRIDPPDSPSSLRFTAWADPTGAQIRDACGSLGLDQTGLRQVTGSMTDARKCWHARSQ